jgi:hypothetical protein
MKLQNVPLNQIVSNPWRDTDLYPIDEDHVRELRESINDHDFFSSLIGRRVGGKVEIACGHARVAAARKARLDNIPVNIADLDDDEMLRVMVDENSTQEGNSPGAVLNEVASVSRRLVGGLLEGRGNGTVAPSIIKAFADKAALATAQTNLQKRANNPDSRNSPFGEDSICRFLGNGHPEKSHRSLRQIRETISALKQSGTWDKTIDAEILKHPMPVEDAEPAKKKEIERKKPAEPRKPLIDERAANAFKTESQFTAFRQAVVTQAAQKAIPVKEQAALAKEIMRPKHKEATPKQVTTGYIKDKVQERVQEYMKEQRQIDKEERDRYLAEQTEIAINQELENANRNLRSLISNLMKLEKLAEKYPAHPKIGGFSARLDDLVDSIKQFSRKIK